MIARNDTLGDQNNHEPIQTVKSYLQAMEDRQLAIAQTFVSDDFTMTFPGNVEFRDFESLVEWSKERYQFVKKSFENFDLCIGKSGTVVVCNGSLSGLWRDGSAFEGIRFIDRFELKNGRISKQSVYNDLALYFDRSH